MAVKPVPDGFNTVSAYLVVKNSEEALDFYQKAFGAEAGARMAGPDGKSTIHAEMRIGNSTVMLTDENPQWGLKSPQTLGGGGASLHLYVDDADRLFQRAVAAGCTVKAPIMDAFWGDRYGKLTDPFGHEWGIATHKEDLNDEEIGRRAAEFFSSMPGDCGSWHRMTGGRSRRIPAALPPAPASWRGGPSLCSGGAVGAPADPDSRPLQLLPAVQNPPAGSTAVDPTRRKAG